MTDDPQAQDIVKRFQVLNRQWIDLTDRITEVYADRPVNWSALHFLEAKRRHVEGQLRVLYGNDPDDEMAPPF
jgi:hypothetical protein